MNRAVYRRRWRHNLQRPYARNPRAGWVAFNAVIKAAYEAELRELLYGNRGPIHRGLFGEPQ